MDEGLVAVLGPG